MVQIQFKPTNENAKLPAYMTPGAAGADICSCEEVIVKAGQRKLVNTGLECRIPEGYEIQVRPRSGLALKEGLTVLNTPGTIDSDYTGLIKVILYNTSNVDYTVVVGARIAQIVVAPVIQAAFTFTEEDKQTSRDSTGFGTTGV